jgi:hypothetical protein
VGHNLGRWRAYGFDPVVIAFADIVAHPLDVLRRLAGLVGVDPDWWAPLAVRLRTPINATIPERGRPLTPEIRDRLEAVIYA